MDGWFRLAAASASNRNRFKCLAVAQWPKHDDLKRDCSIKTFLSRTVNNALTATSNFFL